MPSPVANAEISVVWGDSIARFDRNGIDLRARDAEALLNARRKPSPKYALIVPLVMPKIPAEARPTVVFDVAAWRVVRRSDESGTYVVCGVPLRAHGIRVSAAADSAASDSIDVQMDPRVHRRDLRIGPVSTVERASRGTVAGQLSDDGGSPFPYAHVVIAGAEDARSDENGRFVIREVAAGTRRIEVRFIGMTPVHAAVDVIAGDTATIALRLNRVPTLRGMNVRAAGLGRVVAAEFDARRRLGVGYLVDSTVISSHPTVVSVLRTVPSLAIEQRGASLLATVPDGRGGRCIPTVWVDGTEAAYGNLFDLTTSEVVGLEVYTRSVTVPAGFVEMGTGRKRGAILVWTKYVFKSR